MRAAFSSPTPGTDLHQRAPTPLIRTTRSARVRSFAFSSRLAIAGANQAATPSSGPGSRATKRSSHCSPQAGDRSGARAWTFVRRRCRDRRPRRRQPAARPPRSPRARAPPRVLPSSATSELPGPRRPRPGSAAPFPAGHAFVPRRRSRCACARSSSGPSSGPRARLRSAETGPSSRAGRPPGPPHA